MPAWRLDDQERQVDKYDVGAGDGSEPHFIAHVLLCNVDGPTGLKAPSPEVAAVHMGPPLKRSSASVDVVGTAALDGGNVDRGERRQIKTFIDDRFLERQAQIERLKKLNLRKSSRICEYVIHPAAQEPDANYPLWRFNCAGFVMHAYLEAGIELIAEERVPAITIDELKAAYSAAANRVDDPAFRLAMGIGEGDGNRRGRSLASGAGGIRSEFAESDSGSNSECALRTNA